MSDTATSSGSPVSSKVGGLVLCDKVIELERQQDTLLELRSALQTAEQQTQHLHVEHSVLREKARRYVLDHRDDRRALRAQAKLPQDRGPT